MSILDTLSYAESCDLVLNDFAVHDHTKKTLLQLGQVDVVDALNSLDLLKIIFEKKFTESLNPEGWRVAETSI